MYYLEKINTILTRISKYLYVINVFCPYKIINFITIEQILGLFKLMSVYIIETYNSYI